MHPQERLESRQCRTCYNSKSNLQLLKSLPDSWTSETASKSYAELLKEVCDINVFQEVTPLGLWPQYICLACRKKLKAAYDFIQETHRINKYLKSLAEQFQTNREHFIEIPELNIPLEIKRETDNDDVEYAVKERVIQDNPLEGEEEAIKVETLASPERRLEREEVFKAEKLADTDNECDESSNFDDEDYTNTQQTDDDVEYNHTNPNKSLTNKASPSNLTCSECNKLFTSIVKLNRHQRFTHVPEDKKLPCHLCNLKFSRTYHLKRHLKNVHIPKKVDTVKKVKPIKTNDSAASVSCTECGKIFCNLRKLTRHQRHAHVPEEKKYVCHMCAAKFGRSDHFRRHMRNLHQTDVSVLEPKRQIRIKDNRFACDKCDRSYTRRCRLYKHEREMHYGE